MEARKIDIVLLSGIGIALIVSLSILVQGIQHLLSI